MSFPLLLSSSSVLDMLLLLLLMLAAAERVILRGSVCLRLVALVVLWIGSCRARSSIRSPLLLLYGLLHLTAPRVLATVM